MRILTFLPSSRSTGGFTTTRSPALMPSLTSISVPRRYSGAGPETREAEMHLPDPGFGPVPDPHVVEADHQASHYKA